MEIKKLRYKLGSVKLFGYPILYDIYEYGYQLERNTSLIARMSWSFYKVLIIIDNFHTHWAMSPLFLFDHAYFFLNRKKSRFYVLRSQLVNFIFEQQLERKE